MWRPKETYSKEKIGKIKDWHERQPRRSRRIYRNGSIVLPAAPYVLDTEEAKEREHEILVLILHMCSRWKLHCKMCHSLKVWEALISPHSPPPHVLYVFFINTTEVEPLQHLFFVNVVNEHSCFCLSKRLIDCYESFTAVIDVYFVRCTYMWKLFSY